ncbi:MAG TPA: c-type cytochrome domain-containing protein [Flavobacteriales bacterium]|jgi:hypothetical protein|nr:c-type cytochrome domain-containing protein [Flavobacteriales bacterium]
MRQRKQQAHLSERADRVLTFGLTGLFFAALLLMLFLPSCKHEPLVGEELLDDGGGNGNGPFPEEPIDTCDPNTVYFEQQVLPILVSNCAIPGCHDAGTHEEGLIMDSYAHIVTNEDIVRPFDLDRDLYEAITENDEDDIMPPPPHQPLSNAQIALIRDWILQGAQNNSCESGCDMTNVTYAGTIRPIIINKCQGCHSGAQPQGGLDFSSYADLADVAGDGRLAGAIQHQAPYTSMPPSGNPLPACQVEQILLWISDGALNN